MVIEKLYKNTFKRMNKHSYYANEKHFHTDIQRIFDNLTNNRVTMITMKFMKTTLKNRIRKRMLITWGSDKIDRITRSDARIIHHGNKC